MRKVLLAAVIVAAAVLIALFLLPFRPGILIPDYSLRVDFSSAKGFEEVVQKSEGGFAKLVISQGATGSVPMTLRRQYTTNKLDIVLWLQGIAPEFDQWAFGAVDNAGLPDGVTYAINPCAFELRDGRVRNATLTIAVSPTAKVGNFKLTITACRVYSSGGRPVGWTGRSFILEVKSRGS